MKFSPELSAYPLCSFLLSGYLTKREDPVNFQPGAFARYEKLFEDGLRALNLSKETLRGRPEFNFDSGDAKALESAIAVLRVVIALQEGGFKNIVLLKANSTTGADIVCEKGNSRCCFEVKTITKESRGRADHFLEEQVFEKIREHASKARCQLKATVSEQKCDFAIYTVVMNWELHTMCVSAQAIYENVNRLDSDPSLGEVDGVRIGLGGIDGVLYVDAAGLQQWFLEDRAKVIDC